MGNVTWPEVWDAYRALEENRWREHYTSRGFDTWSAWRREYVSEFGLESRAWSLEAVADPVLEIPRWWVGAYKGWAQYYPEGKTMAAFADIALHPTIRENVGVQNALVHVPDLTRLIVFRCGSETVVRDGTHRSAAMALRALDGKPYPAQVEIAVAHFDPSERELFLKAYDQRFAKTIGKK